MDLSLLLKLPGVDDIIITDDSLYVIGDPSPRPVIYTDKQLLFISLQAVLASPHLLSLLQGKSIKHERVLREHLTTQTLYEYSLTQLEPSEKQTVSHLLSGTGGRNSLLKELGGRRLGRGVVLIPEHGQHKLETFFDTHSVAYTKTRLYTEEDHGTV